MYKSLLWNKNNKLWLWRETWDGHYGMKSHNYSNILTFILLIIIIIIIIIIIDIKV